MKERVKKEQHNRISRDSASFQRMQAAATDGIDRRGTNVAQCHLWRGINDSPKMAFQRKQIEAISDQPVQRLVDEEDLLQGKFNTLQRMAPEEEDLLQGKFSQPVQREQDSSAATNLTGMPDQLKTGIESLSGMDMSDVRVHNNSTKPAQLNALAYAQGNDIHLGAGQEQHLPHEAWHVVQQRQGRVQPTMQMEGQQINDDAGLEREADVMGGKALQYKK